MMLNSNGSSKQAVIVAATRTAVGKAKKGSLATVRPDELASAVIREVLSRAPRLTRLRSTISSLAAPSQKVNRA